jgi:membrane-bound metal-dependent hydrolase YbcI (DUF457 family)
MDPLTHALSGAVAGRAFIPEPDTPRGRVGRAALFLGAVLPDIDVLANPFEPNGLGTIRWHRGVTHSFVCAPVFALLLGAVIAWICRRRRTESPSWTRLSALCGAGIALHIVFDGITSFGTMMWSPVTWSRVSWDTTFIIDPVLTAILLLPLMLCWVFDRRGNAAGRAVLLWSGMSALALGVAIVERATQRMAAASETGTLASVFDWRGAALIACAASAVLALVIGGPLVGGRGFRFTRRNWCGGGVAAAAMYLALSASAHAMALRRVEAFAESRGLQAQEIGALPMPPSILFWAGLVSTPDRIYYGYFNVLDGGAPRFREYAQAQANKFTEAARALPTVQIVLGFFRFPLLQDRVDDGGESHDVEFFDLRFLPRRGDALSFSYRVTFDGAGRVIHEGWIRPRR